MNYIRDAFVIMPFSTTPTSTEVEWTEIYENVFKPALEEPGYACERAQVMTGSLTESIVDRLRKARIVLADITDKNPNVFYELGIRHSLSRRTIIVARGSEHVASDLSGYWFVRYGLRPAEVSSFKREIRRIISLIEENPEKADNPVASYLDRENFSILGVLQRRNAKRLDALHTELSGNLIFLKKLILGNIRLPIVVDCLTYLLHERYIDPGPECLKRLYELHHLYRMINHQAARMPDILKAREDTQTLMGKIASVRDSLIVGEFSEPTALSMMTWQDPIFEASDSYSPLCSADRVGEAALLNWRALRDSQAVKQTSLGAVDFLISCVTHSATVLKKRDKREIIALPPGKVSPRTPCPCGSGKIFKNCCGP